MRSLLPIQSRPAKNAKANGPVPQRTTQSHVDSSQDGLRCGARPEPSTIAAEFPGSLIFPPAAHSSVHREPQNRKTKIKKSQNKVNPTSDHYGARHSEKRKKVIFPHDPNLKSGEYRRPHPAILSCARSLDTLLFYVSDPRRPASPSSPSGDHDGRTGASPLCGFQICVAGPGLIRFCKSNERMPAAIPAGFFYEAHRPKGPLCAIKKMLPRQFARGLRS